MNSWLWNPPPRGAWRRLALECVVIVALGSVLGLSANVAVLRQVLSGDAAEVAAPPVTEGALPVPVMLDEVRELLGEGALAVDARTPEAYREGHLPGAVNLPLADAEHLLAAFAARNEVSRTLVVYCNGYGCPDSFDLAVLLQAHRFVEVRVFEGGFPAWRDAGLPVEGGKP